MEVERRQGQTATDTKKTKLEVARWPKFWRHRAATGAGLWLSLGVAHADDQGSKDRTDLSSDHTLKIWSIADGKLLRTIWIPQGPKDIGRIYAVAISCRTDVVSTWGDQRCQTTPAARLAQWKGRSAGSRTGSLLCRRGEHRAGRIAHDASFLYSHDKDRLIAAALQRVLRKLGKPWSRRRGARLFRDDTNLPATPYLWPAIEKALENSRFLILLASPEAAKPDGGVDRELIWWLANKGPDTVIIALTDGELSWDHRARDFGWSSSNPRSRKA